MPTTASVFLHALVRAGVTHVFVNWGNDHPAILEELERQRVENGSTALKIVTSPHESVALSAAQAFTQVTGTPSAVIVHVDVGTQNLAGAIHNVDRGRTPVLIFAGASPFSAQGELKGSKNEWPMWTQDIPDQAAIVRQYMRYTAQIMSGKNVAKVVMRALQIATSTPMGPTYLYARREVFEEDLEESVASVDLDVTKWPSIAPAGLSPEAIDTIVQALCAARFPLIITGYSGRNPRTVQPLLALSDKLSIALFMACPSAVNVPFSHPHFLGHSFGGKIAVLDEADVIVVVDTDVPWIDVLDNAPQPGAKVFVIDADPLKTGMGWSHVDADMVCRADSEVALQQLLGAANASPSINAEAVAKRGQELSSRHVDFVGRLDALETSFQDGAVPDAVTVLATLREVVAELTPGKGKNTLWLNESITNYPKSFDHIRPDVPGNMLCSGGSSLGWALGAAVGARLGSDAVGKDHDLVVAIVGDGTYLFGIPSSAYWMARKYNTPYLTVIVNNGGWAAPKGSLMGMYPDGYGSKASGQRLSIAFGPDQPDYAQIAAAAGGAWGRRITDMNDLRASFREAIRVVMEEKRSAVLDCVVQSI